MKKTIIGLAAAATIAGCALTADELAGRGTHHTRTFTRAPIETAVCVQRNIQNAALPYVATFRDDTQQLIVRRASGDAGTVAVMSVRTGSPTDIWVLPYMTSQERFLEELLNGC